MIDALAVRNSAQESDVASGQPIVFAHGSRDVIAPDEVGRYVHEHVAGSEMVYLDETGHSPNLKALQEKGTAIQAYGDRHDRAG